MSRIVHLTDLHFGRDRPELVDPLAAVVNRLAPDLVVVSGDFTQRARIHQFARASAFLGRLDAPILSVPGNHDTPLDNLLVRLVRPWSRYRAAIGAESDVAFRTRTLSVVGMNTANPYTWQLGRVSKRDLRRVAAAFRTAADRLRVVVLHHPLEHGPKVDKRLTEGAARALRTLHDTGADLVLSGHLHTTVVHPFTAAPSVLFVQGGTALSDRVRGERNAFNLVTADRRRATVETWFAGADDASFAPGRTARFARRDGVWDPE